MPVLVFRKTSPTQSVGREVAMISCFARENATKQLCSNGWRVKCRDALRERSETRCRLRQPARAAEGRPRLLLRGASELSTTDREGNNRWKPARRAKLACQDGP